VLLLQVWQAALLLPVLVKAFWVAELAAPPVFQLLAPVAAAGAGPEAAGVGKAVVVPP
jgi:hypothetical protein